MKLKRVRETVWKVTFITKMSIALAYIVSLVVFILTFVMSSQFTWKLWLDNTLIMSLILIAIGCSLLIIQGGYIHRKNVQMEDVIQDVDDGQATAVAVAGKKSMIHPFTTVLLVSGFLLVFTMMMISTLTS